MPRAGRTSSRCEAWAIGSWATRRPTAESARPTRRAAGSDGERDRSAGRVVGRVHAAHATSARVTAAERVEVEPRLAGGEEAAAARGAGHGRARAVTDSQRGARRGAGGAPRPRAPGGGRGGGGRGGGGRPPPPPPPRGGGAGARGAPPDP